MPTSKHVSNTAEVELGQAASGSVVADPHVHRQPQPGEAPSRRGFVMRGITMRPKLWGCVGVIWGLGGIALIVDGSQAKSQHGPDGSSHVRPDYGRIGPGISMLATGFLLASACTYYALQASGPRRTEGGAWMALDETRQQAEPRGLTQV